MQKKIIDVLEIRQCVTMDKSANNFEDVEDTMSSVYNAWRKNEKPEYQKNCAVEKIYGRLL